MKLTESELAQLYNQYTAAQPPAACPSAELLTSAAMGELPAAERATLAEHLGACPTCVEEYQFIRSLQPWAAQAAVQLQTEQVMTVPQIVVTRDDERGGWLAWLRSLFALPVVPYAAATALLLLTAFLAYQLLAVRAEKEKLLASARTYETQAHGAQTSAEQANQELQRTRQQLEDANRKAQQTETQLAELRRAAEAQLQLPASSTPQLNVPIIDLMPPDTRGQGERAAKQITVPAGVQLVTLILNVNGQPTASDFALEIWDQQGRQIYRGSGLKKNAENSFTVAVSRALLGNGQYRFKLFSLQPGPPQLVQEYLVQLRFQA